MSARRPRAGAADPAATASADRPLLVAEDAAFDALPEEPSNAAANLRVLASAQARGRLAHALVLAGPRGSGKRWCAVRLAQLLACAAPREDGPCGACAPCDRTVRGLDPDVTLLEPGFDEKRGEARTEIPVEAVRRAQERLSFRAAGTRRVVLVDPADRLSPVAQEALLKTLEEPPQGVTLLLLTARPSFLKPTVRSRAHLVRFAAPGVAAGAAAVVAAAPALTAEAARVAVGLARGDLRRAQSLDADAAGEEWLGLARALYELLGPRGERRARDVAVGAVPSREESGGREKVAAWLDLLQAILRDTLVAGGAVAAGAAPTDDALAPRLLHGDGAKAARALSGRLPPERAAAAIDAVEAAREDLALHGSAKVILTHLLLALHGLRSR